MSDQDLFNNKPQESSPPADNVNDLLMSIKNEHGEPKYRSTEEALKALANSQAFIPQLLSEKKQLEDEMNKLREQANKAANLDEVIEKLRTAGMEHKKPEGETHQSGGLSEEAVANLVKKALEERETSVKARSNFERVNGELVKKFGQEKAQEAVAKKAAELGTSTEALGKLAAESPELVLALFGDNKPKPPQPTTSSVNLPFNPPASTVQKPAKSLLIGATSRDQTEFMKQIKEDVYRRHGVTS